MSKKKPLVGFDRYVEKQWMDQAAELAMEGMKLTEVNELLDEYLVPSIEGETSRRKTKNILTATWTKSSKDDSTFKAEAVQLFKTANKTERLAIHYGMSIATYPYFLSLSKILGRLFKLQDEVTNAEFNRRVIETVGDRDSIKRASARYLQSLIQWGILNQIGKSTVGPGKKLELLNSDVVTWLFSSVLFSENKDRLSVDDVLANPAWFPFDIDFGLFEYSNSKVLDSISLGAGTTFLSIRK